MLLDCFFLLVIICPLFIIGLRFWTAPTYLNYTLKINGLIAPLAVPIWFLATHWDIVALAALVFYMNFYAFWYHVDPPSNIYQTSRKRVKDINLSKRL